MDGPTLTDMHIQARRELRWPTILRLSTDVIISEAPADEGTNVDFIFLLELGSGARCVKAHLCVYEDHPMQAGVYTLNNVTLSTHPVRVFVPDDACMRMVPEEFDGSDPIMSALPLCSPVVTGVGVVRDVDPDCGSFTVVGLSYQGSEHGWIPFEFLAHANLSEGPFPPQEELPRPCTLVSFDGVLRGTPSGTTLRVDIHRLQHLQYAHTTLLAKLGIVPDHAGKVFAERAAQRAIQDQKKIGTLQDAGRRALGGAAGQAGDVGQGGSLGQANGDEQGSSVGHGSSWEQGNGAGGQTGSSFGDVGAKRIRRF
ncbi:hypothetical protein OC834_003967 [Tilletia horrida]|uniref:Uncharacterized protein n=1 Tax=Tilletia horrida TaxID=155126 RepID=A0AAN6G8M8_9BASI|nr:hypothetical protein OC842_005754 [Tilletia horrida]KAK0528708.1 hypothetical protein OC834_003967 [Tilletia horrida]